MARSRIFVSPNVGQDLPIEKSVRSLTGGEQARFRSLARDLIGTQGSTHNSVGAWIDGSEPVVSALANVDPATARKLAGHLGKAAHQKAVLVFHEDPNGPQVIHDVQVHGTDIPAIHKSLLAHGINQHTITPGQHSTVVSVYDQDGSQTQPVATFTRAAHGHHTQTKGTGEFLGDPNWASRAKAKQEYAKLSRVKKARTNEPHPVIHDHARDYMAKAGLPFDESPLDYAPLDKGIAQQTAAFYDKAPHSPNDPEVQKAYSAFKKETLGQYNHLRSRGVKLEPWIKEGQPYQNSQEMVNDVHGNNHLHYFVGGDMPKDHPLAEHTGLVENGHPITYNDAFRAVHDFYGHAAYGNEFGPRGEEHAWRAHKRMYSPEAQPAMTFETKGQNSWVNFGPHSHLPVTQRPFAEQKANLLKLARRAVERVKKAAGGFHDWPAMVEHWVGQSGLHGKTLGILGDYLEENGNPNHVALRSPQGLYDHYTDWYWKKYPRGLDWDEETRQYVPTTVDLTRGQIASRKKWQSDAIKPQLERLWGSGMSSYAKPSAGAGSFTEFLHELPNHQQSPPAPPKAKRTKKARPIETPEDREHREAEEALSSGQAPSAALIGQLKPGTKKEIGGKQYLRSMDGPHELTEVDPKSFGFRPQKYRNQAIIDKYRAQIRAALQSGKTPLEAVEPVQGEPFQREDINEGKPTNYLRDGNHRTDAAIAEGLEKIPAWFPMKMGRIKKLLARLRRSRSLSSRPIRKQRLDKYKYIEVPEPLTTAQHQHWLDFNLQPHEAKAVERSKSLGNRVNQTAPMSMMLQSTLSGRHGRHWYDENHDILRAATHHSSDPRDFARLAGLEAATSPNNGIVPNQHAAYDLFRLWHTGAMVNGRHIPARSEDHKDIKDLIGGYAAGKMNYPPDYKVPELRGQPLMQAIPHPRPSAQNGGIMKQIHTAGGWVRAEPLLNVHSILSHKVMTNPEKYADPNRVGGFTGRPEKADSFLRNKLGNQHAVTVDRHEARGWGFKEGDLSPGVYHYLVAASRHAARLLNHPDYNPHADHPIHGKGWTGARGQAARWMTMRGLRDAIVNGQSPEEAALNLKAGDIHRLSAFAPMFNTPEYKNRIKTMMAEGSLPPDFLHRTAKIEKMYQPPKEELEQNVGHPDLIPLARRIKQAVIKQIKGNAAREAKLKAQPSLPGM